MITQKKKIGLCCARWQQKKNLKDPDKVTSAAQIAQMVIENYLEQKRNEKIPNPKSSNFRYTAQIFSFLPLAFRPIFFLILSFLFCNLPIKKQALINQGYGKYNFPFNKGGSSPGKFMHVNTDINHFPLEINLVSFYSCVHRKCLLSKRDIYQTGLLAQEGFADNLKSIIVSINQSIRRG
jgi:hypothetical protein